MKKLPITKCINDLKEIGMTVTMDKLQDTPIDVPIMAQLEILLDAIGESGLKLTSKGKLPTKVVEPIAKCRPSSDRVFQLKMAKRFLEDEHVSVQMSRNLATVSKILKVSKNKLMRGSMYEAYRSASKAEQFTYLFDAYLELNLAYFDRAQEEDITMGMRFIMLQLIRDKQQMDRPMTAYQDMLLMEYPFFVNEIELEISPRYGKDAFDAFEFILELRVFKHFYLPFGLISETAHKAQYGHEYSYEKTTLLENFITPVDVIDTALLLNKKRFSYFSQQIKAHHLGVDLSHDFLYFYMLCSYGALEDIDKSVSEIMKQVKAIGTMTERYEQFYRELASGVLNTFKHFTQMELKGGGSRDMKSDYTAFRDGVYATLSKETPYKLMQSFSSSVYFFALSLKNGYDLEITSPNFSEEVASEFSDEVMDDIGNFLYISNELKKRCTKSKRINHKIESTAKDAIHAMLMSVMSIYTYEKDGFI